MFRDLKTEQANPHSRDLDLLDTAELLGVIHEADRSVADAVGRALPEVVRVVDLAVSAIAGGGRIVYVGAGTSGRLGVLDAAECPPTFGTDPSQVVAIIAGGRDAVFSAREGAEDDREAGAAAVRGMEVGSKDLVTGIAASGVTPFVTGALTAARKAGAATAFVTAGRPAVEVDVSVTLDTGPEVLAGSTRMKAGTATKMVLNMISTATMVRTGRVYDNRMVDLRTGSAKLRDRATRLVESVAGVPRDEALEWLARADGSSKTAIVMARCGVEVGEARRRLEAAGGFLRRVLEDTAGDEGGRI